MKHASFLGALFLMAIVAQAQPVKLIGQLKVSGTQLCNAKDSPIVLKGMSLGWSSFHPRFYNKGVVKELANAWSCNVVRAAMAVEPKGGYLNNKKKATRLVCNVIDAAIEQGVYVIVDWHSHNIQIKEAVEFFSGIAKKYGHYPNIIYEIFNEPDYESWAATKLYSETVVEAIRKIDDDNIILIGSPHWDQHLHLPAENPLKGYNNLMYTMHFYAGTHKKELRDVADSAMAKGLPVFISESGGMEATGDGPVNDSEWQAYIDWMKARKMSWVSWSVSDKKETCSVLYPSASSNGNWKAGDITGYGKMLISYLRNY